MKEKLFTKKWMIGLVFTLIIIIAIFLRVYRIQEIPVSMYWDETATIYNAYSIAQTGKDEYGISFPLLFRSFDDYKMPGNIYLTAVAVKFFGLNVFSARITSAFAGVGTVFFTYYLVNELFSIKKTKNKREEFIELNKEYLALFSAFLLTISPWHIQFSRTGFEANVALFFVVSGCWAFLKGLRNNNYLSLSLFLFAISIYFYRSSQVFIPLFILSLLILFKKELLQVSKQKIFSAGLIFLIVLLPLLPWIFSGGGLARAKQVSVSNQIQEQLIEQSRKIDKNGNKFIDRVLYNRRIIYVENVISGYVSHFTPEFLFIKGDANGRHHVAGMGMLYVWESIFILTGIGFSFFLPNKIRYLLLAWLLIAPIPASLSFPNPHALRSLTMLPIPQIYASLGVFWVISLFQKKNCLIFISALSGIIILFFVHYLYLYYVVTPEKTADDWADGYQQLTQYILPKENVYEKIIVSGHYWQPYIYFLYYKQYNPALFQRHGSSIGFGKYYFGGTGWDRDKGRDELDTMDLYKIANHKKTLVALSPEEYGIQEKNLKNVQIIYNSFGKKQFLVGELK